MTGDLKIGIVGVGAIGTVFALLLKDKGYDIEITKKSTMGLMIDNCVNLEINGAFGDRSYLVPYKEKNEFSSKKEVLFVLTKSYSVESAYNDVKEFLSPNGVVVTIQNVLNYDKLISVFPKDRFVPLVIDFNAVRVDENHVDVLKAGEIHVGAVTPKSEVYIPFLKEILSCISEVKVEKDMPAFIVSRFMLSNTISSVCAITGYNLGKTLQYKTAKKLFIGLISEDIEVFKAEGIKILPYNDVFDYEQFVEKSWAGIRYRSKMFSRLIKQNGEMVSSTLRALENKKPTELDSMCARVVEIAHHHDLKVPYNEAVATFLQEVEDGTQGIYIENLENEIFKNLEI